MQKRNRFLLDANSVLLLIRSNDWTPALKLSLIQDSKILDLTFYEVGNGIWKECVLTNTLGKEEADSLVDNLDLVFQSLEKVFVNPSEMQHVLNIAMSERETFYDSSYIYVAKREKFTLVTDDQRLSKIAKKYVQTASIREIMPKDTF